MRKIGEISGLRDLRGHFEGGGVIAPTPAQLFINAALITGATQQAALTQLVQNLQGTGSTTNNTDVWSSLSAVYPFCPIDGSTASLTAYKWNLVNPLDTDAAFRITWANSPTASINGIEGDGATQFGNTNFKPSLNVVSIDDYGFSASNKTLGADGAADVDMGVYDGNFNHMIISNATYTAMIGDIASRVGGTSSTIGIRTASRTASNLLTLYLNGAADGTPATALGGVNPSIDFYILGRNDNGSLVNASDKIYDFFAIHKGLTANQAKDLSDSISTYNTALGR